MSYLSLQMVILIDHLVDRIFQASPLHLIWYVYVHMPSFVYCITRLFTIETFCLLWFVGWWEHFRGAGTQWQLWYHGKNRYLTSSKDKYSYFLFSCWLPFFNVHGYAGTAIVDLDSGQHTSYPSSPAAASPLNGSSWLYPFCIFSVTII